MAKLITETLEDIPPLIYYLCLSVIESRTVTYRMFLDLVSRLPKPDPEIERSNATHKAFIDTITTVFEIFGGPAWKIDQDAKKHDMSGVRNNLDEVIFSNKFAAISLQDHSEIAGGEVNSEEDEIVTPNQKRQLRKSSGKKGKKSSKGRKKTEKLVDDSSLDDVPLESYRIIEADEDRVTDYLMAVYALVREWMSLRSYLGDLWREVAYQDLNGAVAGTVSTMAVSMVKRTQSAIFVEFEGSDTYHDVMMAITRGNPDEAQRWFKTSLLMAGASDKEQAKGTKVDVKEQCLIYTYGALEDFIADFRKNHNGRPSRSMLAEIDDWNPHADLPRLKTEERLAWRRKYAINWLYDMVNTFSEPVVHKATRNGVLNKTVLAATDWSENGVWDRHVRLFGLKEFAGFITHLAWQKPGTDIRRRILPHHVFQLQCMVDSWTAVRGWDPYGPQGQAIRKPALAPVDRDIEAFLDRKDERWTGYLEMSAILTKRWFKENCDLYKDPHRHDTDILFVEGLRKKLQAHLGMIPVPCGHEGCIQPTFTSRFVGSDPHGLWRYSPFLCGVGLMEALELAYRAGMQMWDRNPEPIMILHLHNMLVQKGHLLQPLDLLGNLQNLFTDAIFTDGKLPTSNFYEAFKSRVRQSGSREAKRQRQEALAKRADSDHVLLDVQLRHFFNVKSNLLLYREADWNPERIPDNDLDPFSFLAFLRLSQTKQTTDAVTGERKLDDTDLVRRARSRGLTDDEIIETLQWQSGLLLSSHGAANEETPSGTPLASLSNDQQAKEASSKGSLAEFHKRAASGKHNMGGTEILALLARDIEADICERDLAFSGINFVRATNIMLAHFFDIEKNLQEARNPLYIRAYEDDPPYPRDMRAWLTQLVLMDEDTESLKVIAETMEQRAHSTSFDDVSYWTPHWQSPAGSGIQPPCTCGVAHFCND